MDLKELKELLQILEDKEIAEFELEEEGMKLRVRKASAAREVTLVPQSAAVSLPASAPIPPPPVSAAAGAAPTAEARSEAEDGLFIVKSPIVGTFYRTPDPNSAPYVSVGDRVSVGQVLCIIEAMKLMNEIEAEVAGEIVKVHHESGQPVQYGEPLFSIRPV